MTNYLYLTFRLGIQQEALNGLVDLKQFPDYL